VLEPIHLKKYARQLGKLLQDLGENNKYLKTTIFFNFLVPSKAPVFLQETKTNKSIRSALPVT